MNELTDPRGMFRLGVLITAMTVMVLSIAVIAPIDDGALPWLALGLLGAIGIGLVFRARFARVLGGLLALACVVFAPVSLIGSLAASPPLAGADLAWSLSVANAITTTLLLMWLCICALRVVLGRPRRASVITARLAGCALAIVAAEHLWLAYQVGFASTGSWSIHISAQGTQLVGFSGWPLWHAALLIVALVMASGPRQMLGHAATVLLLLFATLVPLVIVAAVGAGLLGFELLLFELLLLPVYLSWWLRDELLRAEPARRSPG
jgi:hypothetical protein